MNNIFFLIITLFFVSSAFAGVHKWKDENGVTHYGDAPFLAGTTKVRTDKDENVDRANAARINKGTQEAVDKDAFDEALASAKISGKCNTFKYYVSNDDEGEALANAAKDECFRNMAFVQIGKKDQEKQVAYTAWKEHYEQSTKQRQAFQQAIRNGQTQEKLDSINRNLDAIRSRQIYGN